MVFGNREPLVGRDAVVEASQAFLAVSIWEVGADGMIVSYRIFVDQAPVYAP